MAAVDSAAIDHQLMPCEPVWLATMTGRVLASVLGNSAVQDGNPGALLGFTLTAPDGTVLFRDATASQLVGALPQSGQYTLSTSGWIDRPGSSGAARWFMDAVDMSTGTEKAGFPVALEGSAQNAPSQTFSATFRQIAEFRHKSIIIPGRRHS